MPRALLRGWDRDPPPFGPSFLAPGLGTPGWLGWVIWAAESGGGQLRQVICSLQLTASFAKEFIHDI